MTTSAPVATLASRLLSDPHQSSTVHSVAGSDLAQRRQSVADFLQHYRSPGPARDALNALLEQHYAPHTHAETPNPLLALAAPRSDVVSRALALARQIEIERYAPDLPPHILAILARYTI